MSIPGMPNPTEAVAEVEKSLKELAEQTGLSKVDGVVAKFKETAEAAKKGPSEIIDKLKGAMTEFTGKLTAAINHPEDLVAGSGALALIAAWYGRSVAGKLQELAQEAGEIATTVSQQGSKVAEPFQNIPKLLGDVQETLGAKVAGLTKLLADLQLLGSTVKGPADLAKVETKAMKEALDMGSLGDLLKKLGELKASLGPLISSISGVIDKIEDFLSTVSDKLTRSFDVPHPLCFLTGCAMQQAPAALTELLEKVKQLRSFSLKPLQDAASQLHALLQEVDVEKSIRQPLESFAQAALPHVDKLDKAVSAAKLAGKPGVLGKLF